jgi:LCP family protein required for cell wall assembly
MFNKKRKTTVYNATKPKINIVKWILFVALVLIIGLGVWIGSTAFNSINKITAGSGTGNSILSLLSSNKVLKGQTEGRTNILLLGYGGGAHSGTKLSDTMDVISIDWIDKKIAMISVPRDLWVNIPSHGYRKINEAYSDGGGQLSSQVVNQVLNIPIDYYIALDFNGFADIVNAVGGVDINVADSFTDYTYPAGECNNDTGVGCAVMTIHFDAGLQHMNGARALIYVRSRHSLDNSEGTDFARSRRQQLLMAAIKTKALSVGVLANPIKVTELLNSVGSHLTMNMSADELMSLWNGIKDIDTSNMASSVFDTSPTGPLAGDISASGQDILVPKKGLGNYIDLQAIAKNIFDPTFVPPIEPAVPVKFVDPTATAVKSISIASTVTTSILKIQLLGSSASSSHTADAEQTLKSHNYNVVSVVNSATAAPKKTTIYNCAGASAAADAKAIAVLLGGAVKTKTSCVNSDIQIIAGQNIL